MLAPMNEAAQRAIDAFLARSEQDLRRYVDQAHYLYLDLYLERADALHHAGAPAEDVLVELRNAGRCYAAHATLYLDRWPLHQLKSRCVTPLELALVAGDADIQRGVLAGTGGDAMAVLAEVEPPAQTRQIAAVVGGTIQSEPADPFGVAGLLGVLYWLALSALLAGDVPGLEAVALRTRAARGSAASIIAAGPAALQRLDALHAAIAAALAGDAQAFVGASEAHAGFVAAGRATDAESPWRGTLDRTSIALATFGVSVGLEPASILQSTAARPYLAALRRYLDLLSGAR